MQYQFIWPFPGLELIPDRIRAISWHGDSFTKCWPPDGCSRDLDGGETFSIFHGIRTSNVIRAMLCCNVQRSKTKSTKMMYKCGLIIYPILITVTSQWARWRLKSTAFWLFTERFVQVQIKENIKAPRHWPLCGEFTADRWIPRTKGQLRGKCFHLMTSSCALNFRNFR